jgi:hypothetical protein
MKTQTHQSLDFQTLTKHIEDFCKLMTRKGYDVNKFDGPGVEQNLQDILYEQVRQSPYQQVNIFHIASPLDKLESLAETPAKEIRFARFTLGYTPERGFHVKGLEIRVPPALQPARTLHTRPLFNNADIPAKQEALSLINRRKKGIKQ